MPSYLSLWLAGGGICSVALGRIELFVQFLKKKNYEFFTSRRQLEYNQKSEICPNSEINLLYWKKIHDEFIKMENISFCFTAEWWVLDLGKISILDLGRIDARDKNLPIRILIIFCSEEIIVNFIFSAKLPNLEYWTKKFYMNSA